MNEPATSADRPNGQRGFSVPEIMIAMILMTTLGFCVVVTLGLFSRALEARSFGQRGTLTLEQQLDGMRGDAASAFAVFVPDKDVKAESNLPSGVTQADPARSLVGHEVDFFTKTDTGAERYWAYYFDAQHRTLRRYDYDAAGHAGVARRDTGAIDPAQRYPALEGVRAFSVRRFQADQLTDATNAFAPVLRDIASSAGAPAADPIGFVPQNARPRDDLYGGNTLVQVQIETEHGSRTLHLATSVAPSGFTIHEAPAIRAFVYRINTVHRSWAGIAQKTHAHIFEQLQYSYHPLADANKPWKVWCDFEVYGSGSNGLTLNDPNVDYHPRNYIESTAGVFFYVTSGGAQALDPAHCNSGQKVPAPNESATPQPAATNPEPTDTPPPCFAAGTCWPSGAPPDWTPPSPWPATSPPPSWCATHSQSGLCGGPGPLPPGAAGTSAPASKLFSAHVSTAQGLAAQNTAAQDSAAQVWTSQDAAAQGPAAQGPAAQGPAAHVPTPPDPSVQVPAAQHPPVRVPAENTVTAAPAINTR